MSSPIPRLNTALKAVSQLGLIPVTQAAIYRLGLIGGVWRRRTPAPQPGWLPEDLSVHFPYKLPGSEQLVRFSADPDNELFAEAEEICRGKARLFGGPATALVLTPQAPLSHWTEYEKGKADWGAQDVKLVWEPARFGWALTLARAYVLSGKADYAEAFWRLAEEFVLANPPYLGPHWASSQEVAMRIMAISMACEVFSDAPGASAERKSMLAKSLAAHAARIPPTLIYARSQNNNHLLSEAAGLYTAGIVLADLPQARQWEKQGWQLYNKALQRQIARNGTYIQHSLNYHRLMLQTGLWMQALAGARGITFPRLSQVRLAAATQWLLDQIDPLSGKAPNLGHNDGTYLFPLASGGYADYRPVAQAASRAFLGHPAFAPGPWDEMGSWFNLDDTAPVPQTGFLASVAGTIKEGKPQGILRSAESWASLRAVKYSFRPGQCDQMHVDLWWKGQNLALDAGTYSYNAAPPWDNRLADTAVHNTVQVDGRDQMRRAGRFLWLDWAQAYIKNSDSSSQKITAVHTGYRNLGVRHQRSLIYSSSNHWQVLDSLLPVGDTPQHHSAVLNWLLPDLPWELHGTTLRLKTPEGIISIRLALADQTTAQTYVQLVRAGSVIAGPGSASTVLGWYSPTYSIKIPALSFRFIVEGVLPLSFSTDWFLP